MRLNTRGSAVLFSATLLSSFGCKSVERFDTGSNGAFCGELVGGTGPDGLSDALIPDGSTIKLKLALTLNSQRLADYPGLLTSNDASDGLCAGQPLFYKATLRTIQPALRDAVASVQITPDHNQDIFTWVDSSCQGTFLIILSLMDNGTVELRLFKPWKEADAGAPANSRAGFGVFSLTRSDSGCGF